MNEPKLVTKEWLAAKIAADPSHTIGRALVALFHQQTADEQQQNTTRFRNGAGFSKPDARIGAIAAKTFLKNGKLEAWQLAIWLRADKHGLPRIVKYADQLNAIAKMILLHNVKP